MVNPDLQNYIVRSRQQGMTDEQIRQNLAGQGWKEKDVVSAFTPDSLSSSRKFFSSSVIIIFIIILGVLLLFPVFMVFIFGGAFMADTSAGANQALLSMGAGILYPILLILLSIYSWKNKLVLPVIVLLLLYVLPMIYLFGANNLIDLFILRRPSQQTISYKKNLAEENAPLIQEISIAKRDFVCPDPYSDEKFIYMDTINNKVKKISFQKRLEVYFIDKIGTIEQDRSVTLTTRWEDLKNCLDKNGKSIFDVYNIKQTN